MFYAPIIIKRLSSKRFSARFEIEIFGTILTDYHYRYSVQFMKKNSHSHLARSR